MGNTRHLDMGCGRSPRNPYGHDELYGVDIQFPEEFDSQFFVSANLSIDRIPFDDGFFDSLSAYEFLEHVPRVMITADGKSTTFPFVLLMNEVWRVLKPGGRFYAVTPAAPHRSAFQDPTHVNYITRDTHSYFVGSRCGARVYGFTGLFSLSRLKSVRPKYDYEPIHPSLYQTLRRIVDILHGRLSHVLWEFKAIKHE